MRTLLVTGHTGFVGRTVPGVLQRESDKRWRLVTLPDGFDVRSRELTRHLVDLRPDAVLHLGGLTSVAESYRNPDQFFDVNFNGTWNLLKALRAASFAGRLLFVSSGDCYGAVDADDLPVRETHPMRPRSPYAVSKVAAEANALKHAGPTAVTVRLTYDDNIRAQIVDEGSGERRTASRRGASGHGLVGMRERAAVFGGTFEAGPHGNGWCVDVSLPIPSARMPSPLAAP